MRIAIYLVLFSLVSGIFSLALSQTNDDYPFPFQNPFVSSIISTAIMYTDSDYEKFSIDIRQDRKNVPVLENRSKITFGIFAQKIKNAPVAFIISGTGSGAMADRSLWMGKQLHTLGYHAVLVPNTMHFQFALGVSETGTPGYTPQDTKEYYQMLTSVMQYLEKQKGIHAQSYSVMGYSLGALLAGFLKQEDIQQKVFNFNKVVMFNPAVDVGYAINVLDEYYAVGDHIPQSRKEEIQGRVFSVGSGLLETGFTVEKAQDAIKLLDLSEDEMKWLVGDTFRGSLRDVVYVSQQINDLNILTTPVTKYRQSGRLEEARKVNFFQYMTQIVVPNVKSTDLSVSELIRQSSMEAIETTLRSSKNVYIFENADDFFVRPQDIQMMRTLVDKDKFFLYPYGGHCGNYWFPKNQADLASVMKFR